MACYRPIRVYRSNAGINKETGKWPVVFNRREGYEDLFFDIPCGQCIGCRLERSRQWAMRCVHESSLFSDNSFLTLTYDDDNLNSSNSLKKRDFVLFMKRLRKQYGEGIRFFHCGEYGELLNRPHHHAIIFNFDFDDKVLFSSRKGVRLFRSDSLEKLWPYGFSTIGDVNFESAAYVARYVVKKVTGPGADDHYQGCEPEYLTMSRRPGIGFDWFKKFKNDVYPHDYVVIRDGIKCHPARYYDDLYDRFEDGSLSGVKRTRVVNARSHVKDNTPKRLRVRERVHEAKAVKLKRTLD